MSARAHSKDAHAYFHGHTCTCESHPCDSAFLSVSSPETPRYCRPPHSRAQSGERTNRMTSVKRWRCGYRGCRQRTGPLTRQRGGGGCWSRGPQDMMEAQTLAGPALPSLQSRPLGTPAHDPLAVAGSLAIRLLPNLSAPPPHLSLLLSHVPSPGRHKHYPAGAAAALAFTERRRGWRHHGNFAAEEKYRHEKWIMRHESISLRNTPDSS